MVTLMANSRSESWPWLHQALMVSLPNRWSYLWLRLELQLPHQCSLPHYPYLPSSQPLVLLNLESTRRLHLLMRLVQKWPGAYSLRDFREVARRGRIQERRAAVSLPPGCAQSLRLQSPPSMRRISSGPGEAPHPAGTQKRSSVSARITFISSWQASADAVPVGQSRVSDFMLEPFIRAPSL